MLFCSTFVIRRILKERLQNFIQVRNARKKNNFFLMLTFSFFLEILGNDYPDIIESVQSDLSEVPQIKIRMVNADEDDDDNADATITLDPEDNESEESEEDDDDLPFKKRKLPKTKSEDIHSFL